MKEIIIEYYGLGNVTTLAYLASVPPLSGRPNIPSNPNYKIPNSIAQDKPLGTSALGTPVWERLTFCPSGSFSYTDPVTNQAYNVPQLNVDTVLITISRPTKIISTSVQGRDNEVIEYIGKSNWEINIKGGFYGAINQRPKDNIATLKQLEGAKTSIPVFCNLFKEWDIDELVIESINLPTLAGSYSYQLFEITAKSDVPFVIQSSGSQINNPSQNLA
jgi:hypothetical protein